MSKIRQNLPKVSTGIKETNSNDVYKSLHSTYFYSFSTARHGSEDII